MSNVVLKCRTKLASVTALLKNHKFGTNFVLIIIKFNHFAAQKWRFLRPGGGHRVRIVIIASVHYVLFYFSILKEIVTILFKP